MLWHQSKAGRRTVGIPAVIIPALREHLSVFTGPDAGSLVFAGVTGVPLRRSNFNKMSAWPHAVSAIGAKGLHVHDLRHTGNMLAAPGASLADLKARMGHDSARAAMSYQHATTAADRAIAAALSAQIEASGKDGEDRPDDDDGLGGVLVPAR